MAKFRCKQSGGVMEFTNEYDIEQLRNQEDYEEVFEQEEKPRKKVVTKRSTNKEE
jgi:hypothetical protein